MCKLRRILAYFFVLLWSITSSVLSAPADSCFLHDDLIFLVDTCCVNNTQYESLKNELAESMNVFSRPLPNAYQAVKVGVYLYSSGSTTPSPELPITIRTYPIVTVHTCNDVSCLRRTVQNNMIRPVFLTSTTSVDAIKLTVKNFPSLISTETRRRTIVLITSGSTNTLQQSYAFANSKNIKLFVVVVGTNISTQFAASNDSAYVSESFNCSTCQLTADLRSYLNSSDHCPPEQHWCEVHGCHADARCQWRYPFCNCGNGFVGDGKSCEGLYLHEFWQGLTRDQTVYKKRIKSLEWELETDFKPPYSLDRGSRYKGVKIISVEDYVARYYVQYAGIYETVDTLLQRYATRLRKWEKYGSTVLVGMPQPIPCFHSYPNHISSYYFPNALVNTRSLSWAKCPQGFSAASIQCVTQFKPTNSGVLLGATFDPNTLNTVFCNATLSKININNFNLSELAVTTEKLQLLTSADSLSVEELNAAINIFNSVKTILQNSASTVDAHVLANLVSATSNLITGLEMNPTYHADLKMRYSLVETLSFFAHALNKSGMVDNMWEFKSSHIAVKVHDIGYSQNPEVYFAPRKPINDYNNSLYPLNATLAIKNSPAESIRTLFIYLNSTTTNKPDLYKQGLVYLSPGGALNYAGSKAEVTVEMLDNNETYGRNRNIYAQNALVRLQCVTWDNEKSDWSTEGCCLDSSFWTPYESRTVCKCSGSKKIVSMQSTSTVVAPIVEHSLVTIIVGSFFCFVVLVVFTFMFLNRNTRNYDVFFLNRMLCIAMVFVYLVFMFGVPCRDRFDLHGSWTENHRKENWSEGVRNTILLHLGLLSTWLLLSVNSYYTYRLTFIKNRPTDSQLLFPLLLFVVVGIAVAIDASVSLAYYDSRLENHDLCDTKDIRFLSSTYLSDDMCWISGGSFYVMSFLCLVVAVGGCLAAAILTFRSKVGTENGGHATKFNVVSALILSLLFGFCCVFGQLMLVAVDNESRNTMEIVFAIFTCLLAVFIVWSMCVQPCRTPWTALPPRQSATPQTYPMRNRRTY